MALDSVDRHRRAAAIDPWLLDHLACPTHGGRLDWLSEALRCPGGCRFAVVHGVPIMLPVDLGPVTHENAHAGRSDAANPVAAGILHNASPRADAIDDWVQEMVAHTNSTLYTHLAGRLTDYPIPSLPLPPAQGGATFLDIGCGWGRWSIAAARQGYLAVGVDTSLRAALAAARVARQLDVRTQFVVADSRYLPFRPRTFDIAYSYSVLQHFAKHDVVATLASLKPLLRPGGVTKLHLLNAVGLRSLTVQLRRGFRAARGFETRYWSIGEMLRVFEHKLGPSHLEVDGFFVQGRYEDRTLFRWRHRAIVEVSRALVRLCGKLPPLVGLADNLFVVTRH
jgi:SAM-dependent methyltransferase